MTKIEALSNESSRDDLMGGQSDIINIDDSDTDHCIDDLFPVNDILTDTMNSPNSSILSLQQVTRISDVSSNNNGDKSYDSIQIIQNKNEKGEKKKEENNSQNKNENISKSNNKSDETTETKKKEEEEEISKIENEKKNREEEVKKNDEEKINDKPVFVKVNSSWPENDSQSKENKKNNQSHTDNKPKYVKDKSNCLSNDNHSKDRNNNNRDYKRHDSRSRRSYSRSRSRSRSYSRSYRRSRSRRSYSRSRRRSRSYSRSRSRSYRRSLSRSGSRRRNRHTRRSTSSSYDRGRSYSRSRSYDNKHYNRSRSKSNHNNILVVKPPIYKNIDPQTKQKQKQDNPVVKHPESVVQKENKEKDKTKDWDNKISSKKELLSIIKEEVEKDEEESEAHESAFNDFLNSTTQQQQHTVLPPIIDDPLFENNKDNKPNDSVDYSTVDWKVPLYTPCRPGEPVGSVKYIKPEEPKKAQPLNVIITDNNNNMLPQLNSLPSLIPMVQIPNTSNNNNNISPPILPLIPRIDKSQFPPQPLQVLSSSPSLPQVPSFSENNNNNNNSYNSIGITLDPRLNLTNQQPNNCINPQPNKIYAILSGVEKVDAQMYCQYFNIVPINCDTPYTAFQYKKVNISYVFVHQQLILTSGYKNQFGYYCYLLSENCKLLSYKYLEESYSNQQFIDQKKYLVEPPRHCLNIFSDIKFKVDAFPDDNSIKIMVLLGGGIIIESNINDKSCIKVVKRIDGRHEAVDDLVTERHVRLCIKHPETYHI